MTRAYVLIKTEVGKTEAAQQELRSRPGVRAADVIIGPYDIIAVVEAPDLNAVGKLVLNQVHGVSGVENTLTCPVVE
ncbi:MAG: Lrp/AsnC ligand binding domain-containing protein [Chloroflexi bacterium]|nr:Lrp/AsnC ligand binding domain-containing protein [Chloroflexota bacterium]